MLIGLIVALGTLITINIQSQTSVLLAATIISDCMTATLWGLIVSLLSFAGMQL